MNRSLILIFTLLFLAISCQTSYQPIPTLVNKIERGVGVFGPIILEFPTLIQNSELEKGLSINPPVSVLFQWQGTQLNIIPENFFSYDQNYQLSIKKSVVSANEKTISSEYFWTIKTHPACIIYISSATQSPEIWKTCLDDYLKIQLSRSQGKILEFNLSEDGNWIIYSIQNDLGGTDLWMMDRDGKANHVFYQCREDLCREPKFAPDGLNVMFIRNKKNNENLSENINDEFLIVNVASGQVSELQPDQKIKSTFLQWSTDQKYISFFESFSSSFWIWNLKTNQIMKIPSSEGLGGSWKRGVSSFIFADINYWGGIPYGQINQWDEKTNSIQHLFGNENDQNEYFSPKWRPQGDWLAAAVRPVQGSASKQIALFSLDGKQQVLVTNEQLFTFSSFSWSFDGEMIVYQKLNMGTSGLVPEIGLWRMSDQSTMIIAQDASSPKWIP